MDLSGLALTIGSSGKPGDADDVADIISFVEAKWGLDQNLYPVQRIILKAHYGIALDDNPWGINLSKPVPFRHPFYDRITAKSGAEKGFYRLRVKISNWKKTDWKIMSEADYLRMAYAEGRCNIDEVVEGYERREMVLAVGRRSGKTQLAAIVSAYETYKLIKKGDPQKYYGLPVGEPIGMISIATDKKQAGILYNKVSGYYKQCFSADTEIITGSGVHQIGDLVGTSPVILTSNGAWVEAPIRAFGKKPLWDVVLRRQGVEKVVHATENHRWFARDARKPHRGKGYREFTTAQLRPGKHRLQSVYGKTYKKRVQFSPFGVAHGFTFGDGCTVPGQRQANWVTMYGEKYLHLLPYFKMCHQRRGSQGGLLASALPNFFRELPSIEENKGYLLGWLMGYFAADGTASGGTPVLYSAERANLEFARDVCMLLGIGVYGIRRKDHVSNMTGKPAVIFSMAVMRQTLDQSFFIIPGHQNEFRKVGGDSVRRNASHWTVIRVTQTDRVEEVYCATVAGTQTFALAGNILTGNCPFFDPYMANNTMSYARFQTPTDIERYGRYADDEKANATINVAFSPCRAKGLRGPGNLVIIMDELAHFNDSGQSDAKEVYDAVSPSISAFSPKHPDDSTTPWDPKNPHTPPEEVRVEGRIISISSPLGKQGQFYTLFRIGMGGGVAGSNMFCLQAPTWEVNPTVPASEYEKNYLKDANVFFTEYGGEFTDRTRGWITDESDLMACVGKDARPAIRGLPRQTHFVGLDFALAGDGTAIAIGHVEQNKIVLDYLEWIKAGVGKYEHYERLDFDEVADWVLGLSKRFYFGAGLFDQWAGIVFQQALQKRGLSQLVSTHFTKQMSSQMYSNFKDMMFDKRLALFDWPLPDGGSKISHSPHIQELLSLQAEYQTKYITVVEAPKEKGNYDDMSDALIRMVWSASQNISSSPYIAGTASRGQSMGRKGPTSQQVRKAFLKSKRQGGSSPDRQPSRINRGRIKGRY